MHDHVLIPTDGSEEAEAAVRYGLDLAEEFDAKVHALYVIETEATYILTVGLGDERMEEYREYGEDTVSDVVERAADRGLDGTGIIRTGGIATEIVEYAEEHEIESIVMGGQGRGALDKYLGSTAEKVVRMSDLPVTILSPGAK